MYKKADTDYRSAPAFSRLSPLNVDTVSFGDNSPSKKIPHLHCPCCGKEMITSNEVYAFCEKVPKLRGVTAIAEITKYTNQLEQGTVQDKVSNLLVQRLKEKPHITVNNTIKGLLDEYETPILAVQVDHYKKILNIANNMPLPQSYKDAVKVLVPHPDIETLRSLPGNEKNILKRKRLINDLRKLNDTTPSDIFKQHLEAMVAEANEIPQAKKDVGAYIVKYGNRSSEQFLEYLITELQSSDDHVFLNKEIKAYEKFDLVATCQRCNWERGDTPYPEWMASDERHVTNYGNHIKELVKEYGKTKDEDLLNYIGNITITTMNAVLGKPYKKLDGKLSPVMKDN